MSPLTAFVAKLLGAYSLFAGLWLLLRRDAALALVARVEKDPVFLSVIGLVRLAIGLAMVIGHDRWSGWVEILVSLIGWITLFRGLAMMFLPAGALARFMASARFEERLSLYGLGAALLGAALLTGGFTG